MLAAYSTALVGRRGPRTVRNGTFHRSFTLIRMNPSTPMPVESSQDPNIWQQIIGVLLAVIGILGGIIVKLKSSMKNGGGRISNEHLEQKIDERVRMILLQRDVDQWRRQSED